jgi:hypothetical protein
MLVKISFKYYRMIPKGWREYVRSESKDDWHAPKKKRKLWTGAQLKAPHIYEKKKGFKEYPLIGVPPASTGGLTECTIELCDANTSTVFISRIRCSNKDIFCYKTGRELAEKAAREEMDKWSKSCCESSS